MTKGTKKRPARAISTALSDLTPERINAMSPMDVMTLAMQHYLATGDLDRAYLAACALAPYVHPTLAEAEIEARASRSPRKPAH